MEEIKKRKTVTSTAVKNRYNKKNYDVLSVRLPKELLAMFKEKCLEEGVSQASVIKSAIEEFCDPDFYKEIKKVEDEMSQNNSSELLVDVDYDDALYF